MHSHTHNSAYNFGSARFASPQEVKRAGLMGREGLYLGHIGNRQIRHVSDGSVVSICGSGSGKTACVLAWTLTQPNDTPMITLSPRGEFGAITQASASKQGIHCNYWNPKRFHGLPSHSINPLAEITLDSQYLHSDAEVAARDLIEEKTGDNSYFSNRAREWVGAFIKFRVEQDGYVSLPSLYRMINCIESDPVAWYHESKAMSRSRFEDVVKTDSEILIKRENGAREFGAILGSIYEGFAFLHDPELRASLEGGDCKLSDLVGNPKTVRIELMPPAESIPSWSPVLRLMFSRVMTLKSRAPGAQRILMIVDEAGQLGKADFLLRAFTFSRGAGVVVHALFQDIGQIKRNFGIHGVTTFLGSAVARQFFGVRDYETAKMLSDMLGHQTLYYDDTTEQMRNQREARRIAHDVLNGADPFAHRAEYAHYRSESHRQSRMRRPLMDPDEILNMPENRQILFVSGCDLYPIYAHKYRYFERREMAGLYLPNPFHPPLDRVRVKGRLFSKWLPIRQVPKPDHYLHLPQYDGQSTVPQIGNYPL